MEVAGGYIHGSRRKSRLPALNDSPVFACGIQNPGLWNPEFSLNDLESRKRLGSGIQGRDPFNQNLQKFRSKTQWIGSVQPEKFRKNWSTF